MQNQYYCYTEHQTLICDIISFAHALYLLVYGSKQDPSDTFKQ